jgi:hypothetical protein
VVTQSPKDANELNGIRVVAGFVEDPVGAQLAGADAEGTKRCGQAVAAHRLPAAGGVGRDELERVAGGGHVVARVRSQSLIMPTITSSSTKPLGCTPF